MNRIISTIALLVLSLTTLAQHEYIDVKTRLVIGEQHISVVKKFAVSENPSIKNPNILEKTLYFECYQFDNFAYKSIPIPLHSKYNFTFDEYGDIIGVSEYKTDSITVYSYFGGFTKEVLLKNIISSIYLLNDENIKITNPYFTVGIVRKGTFIEIPNTSIFFKEILQYELYKPGEVLYITLRDIQFSENQNHKKVFLGTGYWTINNENFEKELKDSLNPLYKE